MSSDNPLNVRHLNPYLPENRQAKVSCPTMGVQSQSRRKNTQKIRDKLPHQVKRARKRQLFQTGIRGRGFDPLRDCPICVARNNPLMNKPHVAHHPECFKN